MEVPLAPVENIFYGSLAERSSSVRPAKTHGSDAPGAPGGATAGVGNGAGSVRNSRVVALPIASIGDGVDGGRLLGSVSTNGSLSAL